MAQKKDILKELSAPLDISDVDFRIQSISEKGYATILAYKDARVDMNRLDEVCGVHWQDKYELIDGQLFCSIGIKEGDEWIWRMDVGTESQTEKEKGRASDAFKRAGFRWGIGRELYDYPRIFLQLKGTNDISGNEKPEFTVKEVQTQRGKKKIGTSGWGLRLDKWEWTVAFGDDGKVMRLIGKDQHGAVRFDSDKEFNGLPKGNQQPATPPANPPQPAQKKKPKLTKAKYEKAMQSTDVEALTKALTAFELTQDQLGNLTLRIEELKQG